MISQFRKGILVMHRSTGKDLYVTVSSHIIGITQFIKCFSLEDGKYYDLIPKNLTYHSELGDLERILWGAE